jgi:hypothetical protein
VKYAPGILVSAAVVFIGLNMMVGLVLGLVGLVVFVVEKVKETE